MSSSLPPSSLFSNLLFSFLLSLLFPLLPFSSSPISSAASVNATTSTSTSTSSPTTYKSLPSTHHTPHQKCFHQHFSALLQLKRGFNLTSNYTNLSSWNANNPDCCSWEGITCNSFTGHVTGLNLSGRDIGGLLNFQSLFQLGSLQRLDLSENFFDGSPIPSSGMEQLFGNLSGLRELFLDRVNLSAMGNQWSRILSYALPNLHTLSLSDCSLSGPIHPSLSRLHLLTLLDLRHNQLSSPVPEFLSNLTSLAYLGLSGCGLHHKFPTSIFNLPKLQSLDISGNQFLRIYFPKYSINSTIQQLFMSGTDLHGNLADISQNFKSLTHLEIRGCNLLGPIPEAYANFSQLTTLDLSDNNFQGPIPRVIFELTMLRILRLSSNNFTGVVDLNSLQHLKNLMVLQLSDNSLTVTVDPESSLMATSFPQLSILYLSSCNISKFPNMLRNQEEITHLDLSRNRIHGKIPQWIWKVGNGRMYHLNLSNNALEGLEGPFPHLSLTSMMYMDLSNNLLRGLILIPPPSSSFFSLANNSLHGEVPSVICNAKFLEVLDLSNNNFTGLIPQCLGEIGDGTLLVLNLGQNAFHGPLLKTFKLGCKLATLDLSGNQLEGQMPKSLANCQVLTVLNLGNNQIEDEFPSQLGNLSGLHVLVLRSNKFFGSIGQPWASQEFFPQLQIIDLSFNNFSGRLPSIFFSSWKMMKDGGSASEFLASNTSDPGLYYQDKVLLVWKGIKIEFAKILIAVTVVDLSHNHFHGDIPTSIGELKALVVLNLSHNHFQGEIPASFKNLRHLESLDVSSNSLSGKIPWKLTELSSLAVLNLSQNQLVGRIPQDRHFDTFGNGSFSGNPGLCGQPLSKKCEEDDAAGKATTTESGEESEVEFMWIGFGVGHAVGFGLFFWTLALWRRGRGTFLSFVDRVLFPYFCRGMELCMRVRSSIREYFSSFS